MSLLIQIMNNETKMQSAKLFYNVHLQMNYFSRPDQMNVVGAMEWAMATSPPILDHFQSYFNHEYVIDKLGKPVLVYVVRTL